MQLTNIFRALGDDTRLRIISLVSQEPLCVCQISETLKISQPNASKHLGRLNDAGIIECNKVSQWCFYSFSRQFIKQYPLLHSFLLLSVSSNPYLERDLKSLKNVMESGICYKQVMEKINRKK